MRDLDLNHLGTKDRVEPHKIHSKTKNSINFMRKRKTADKVKEGVNLSTSEPEKNKSLEIDESGKWPNQTDQEVKDVEKMSMQGAQDYL